MKNIKVLFIAVVLLCGSLVTANAAGGIYGWTSSDLGSTFDIGDGRTVERVYDGVKGSYVAKVTAIGGWGLLEQSFSGSRVTKGHTYTLAFYVRAEGAANWMNIECGGKSDTPYTPNLSGWANSWLKGLNLDDGGHIKIGLTQVTANVVLYIDDIVLIDEQTGLETDIVINGDFEMEAPTITNIALAGDQLTWVVPTYADWNKVVLCRRSLDGTETVLADNLGVGVASYTVTPPDTLNGYSYVFKLYSGAELLRSASYDVQGKVDFFAVSVTGAVNSGSFNVVLPIQNHAVVAGAEVELIAAVCDGDDVMVKFAKQKQTVQIADGKVNITVPVSFTPEVGKSYSLEVFIWDSIKAMNVLQPYAAFD